MKPLQHAEISAHRHGGTYQDYLPFHNFIDHSKAAFPSVQHRCYFHSDWGLHVVGQRFGGVIHNRDGVAVETTRLFEDHLVEDLGRIVGLGEWLSCFRISPKPNRPSTRHEAIRRNPAEGLAARWGGSPDDYRALVDFMDSPVAFAPEFGDLARLLTHNSFGIYLAEAVLGVTVRITQGRERVISSRSALEDLMEARVGKIPTGAVVPQGIHLEAWMAGSQVVAALSSRSRKEKDTSQC